MSNGSVVRGVQRNVENSPYPQLSPLGAAQQALTADGA